MFADLEIDVHNANTWYNDNKLILNIHKSGCMLFGTRQGFHNNSNIEIILDGDVLQTYECTSYLGVDLINSLSWSQYKTRSFYISLSYVVNLLKESAF